MAKIIFEIDGIENDSLPRVIEDVKGFFHSLNTSGIVSDSVSMDVFFTPEKALVRVDLSNENLQGFQSL